MKMISRFFLLLIAVALLAACTSVSAQNSPQLTATPTEDCDCTLEDILATPTGGITAPGPVGPVASTPVPGAIARYTGQWKTYTDVEHGFAFDYPAVYESPDYAFCAVRASETLPEGSSFALSLGSRTSLTLQDAAGQELQAVVGAFRSDPAYQAYQFEEARERTVGGSPALVLPYRGSEADPSAEVVFFINEGTLYRVDTGTSTACDVPATKLQEADAYHRLLDSFLFAQ